MRKMLLMTLSMILLLVVSACGDAGDLANSSGIALESSEVISAAKDDLAVSACGEVDDSANSSSAVFENSEAISTAEDDFKKASSNFNDTMSELHNHLENARVQLQNVTCDMVMDAEVLESLKAITEEAAAYLEKTVPNMGSNVEDIQRQVGEINEQTVILRDLNEDLLVYMREVEESKRLFEESKKSEIIMVAIELKRNRDTNVSVYSVNPENGQQNIISSFAIYNTVVSEKSGRTWGNLISNIGASQRAPLRGIFSKDYKLIAMTRYEINTQEYHAGYYTENLGFFDATEAAGMVGGDFDEPVEQIAVGFDDDGRFVFAEPMNTYESYSGWGVYRKYNSEWKVYQVETANNGSVYTGSVKLYDDLDKMQGDEWDWLEENCEVTDWIDETHCIVNFPEETAKRGKDVVRWNVRVFDTQTKEYSSLIPGETRTNWSGVISPDGKNVAFLSAPLNGGNASLYYVPIEGGDPIKIYDGISVGRDGITSNVMSRPGRGDFYKTHDANTIVFLVEWTKAPNVQ